MPTNHTTLAPCDPMAVLRREVARLDTPAAVEQALLAAFARQHPPRRWYQRLAQALDQRELLRGAGAIAVMLLVAVGAFTLGPDFGPAPRQPAGFTGNDDFIALEPLERIAQERAPRMVEADVPRIALASLGVAVTAQNADQPVRAEMLVAADGQPLALRLIAVH